MNKRNLIVLGEAVHNQIANAFGILDKRFKDSASRVMAILQIAS